MHSDAGDTGGTLKVLISAYACEPGEGSEPGTGFAWVREAARRNEVWVLTRANNVQGIERAGLGEHVRVIPIDLPRLARAWKRGQRGIYAYYVLWQREAAREARRLHQLVGFDVVHHATFANYWLPASTHATGAPFVWGPVGGGESMPDGFADKLSAYGRRRESRRRRAVTAAEGMPWVPSAAKDADVALATSDQMAERLRCLGAREVRVFGPPVGFEESEVSAFVTNRADRTGVVRFISVGRLQHWKGFHLALAAFALMRDDVPDAVYEIVGTGPEREPLQVQARALGVAASVRFTGWLPRAQMLEKLANADALVHVSLHDPGAWVVAESMAVGTPVICHEAGGPAVLAGDTWPLLVPYTSSEVTIAATARHMGLLARRGPAAARLSEEARERAVSALTWEHQGRRMQEVYQSVASRR